MQNHTVEDRTIHTVACIIDRTAEVFVQDPSVRVGSARNIEC
jgi:hypothetical protein